MAKMDGAGKDSTPRLVEELMQKAHLLALVNGLLRTTLAATSLPEVLLALAPNLKELCPFDRLSVSLYDRRRKQFHVPYVYTKAAVVETGEGPRPYASTPLATVVETRRPLLRRNPPPRRSSSTDTAALRAGPGCEAIFPLLAAERPFGTFQVDCLEPDRLTDEHLGLVEELLPAIASAVHRFAGIIPAFP
jgi:GAF domain-containing protein